MLKWFLRDDVQNLLCILVICGTCLGVWIALGAFLTLSTVTH